MPHTDGRFCNFEFFPTMKTQVYLMRLDCIFSFIYVLALAKRTENCDFEFSNLHFELTLYCTLFYIDMMNSCKHEKIELDDFVSHETDEKGRCTKYLCYSHCLTCNLKFRKFFKLLDSKGKIRTYVMLKEERE